MPTGSRKLPTVHVDGEDQNAFWKTAKRGNFLISHPAREALIDLIGTFLNLAVIICKVWVKLPRRSALKEQLTFPSIEAQWEVWVVHPLCLTAHLENLTILLPGCPRWKEQRQKGIWEKTKRVVSKAKISTLSPRRLIRTLHLALRHQLSRRTGKLKPHCRHTL